MDVTMADGTPNGEPQNMSSNIPATVPVENEQMVNIKSGAETEDSQGPGSTDELVSATTPSGNCGNLSLFSAQSFDDTVWRLCDSFEHLNFLQKVQLKEHALQQGTARLTDLSALLKDSRNFLPNVAKRIDLIGSGKSTVINSLLGYPRLLPSHSGKACTAVCVMMTWNRDEDPDSTFKATISGIDEIDWRNEIQSLIKDIVDDNHDQDDDDGDDGTSDFDRAERIQTAFQKVNSVYPFITNEVELLAANIDELMGHPNVQRILGKELSLKASKSDDFALQIKPYIDSNNLKQEDGTPFSLWPLVKLARLETKSQILRDGLCLIDLPGSHDTNAARSAVAEKFMKSLSVCCVVASSKRAASDKPAQELLGKIRQRQLQLDDQFSTDKLCFIISMSDAFIDVDQYLRDTPKVKKDLDSVLKNRDIVLMRHNQVEDFKAQKRAANAELQKEIRRKRSQLSSLSAKYRPFHVAHERARKRKLDGSSTGTIPPRYRLTDEEMEKADTLRGQIQNSQEELKDLEAQASELASDLQDAQEKLEEIQQYLADGLSIIIHTCIMDRYHDSAREIRNYYEGVARFGGSKRPKENTLQVFNVSSKAHKSLSEGKYFEGFRCMSDTGIPALHDWLVQTTLPTRKRDSEAILETIVSCEVSITPWLADTAVGEKMSDDTRKMIESAFKEKLEVLNKNLATYNREVVKSCEKAVGDLLAKFPILEEAASKKVEDTVRGWAKRPMHWATHRATNRNRGVWRRRGKGDEGDIPIEWNAELAGLYLDPLLPHWQSSIHEILPSSRTGYLRQVKIIIEDFATEMTALVLKNCKDIESEAALWKTSTERTLVTFKKQTSDIFKKDIAKKAKHAHPLIAVKVLEAWQPIYLQCALAYGRGHFKQNQKIHLEHAEKVKRKMFQRGSSAIRIEFDKLWKLISENFEKGTTLIVQQIVDEFEVMLDNHTSNDESDERQEMFLAKKKQVQQATAQIFENLRADWSQTMEFESVNREDPPVDLPMPEVDSLFAPRSKAVDEIIDLSDD